MSDEVVRGADGQSVKVGRQVLGRERLGPGTEVGIDELQYV